VFRDETLPTKLSPRIVAILPDGNDPPKRRNPPALIHDPDVTVRRRFRIGYNPIQFADLERSFVAFVVETNREMC
jgi:hypothetical protein